MWIDLKSNGTELAFKWGDGDPMTWSYWHPIDPNGMISHFFRVSMLQCSSSNTWDWRVGLEGIFGLVGDVWLGKMKATKSQNGSCKKRLQIF